MLREGSMWVDEGSVGLALFVPEFALWVGVVVLRNLLRRPHSRSVHGVSSGCGFLLRLDPPMSLRCDDAGAWVVVG